MSDLTTRAKACFAELNELSMQPAVIERHMGMLVGDKDAEIARLTKERDEATEELIRVCHALECTAQEALSISSRADSIMRSWKEAKADLLENAKTIDTQHELMVTAEKRGEDKARAEGCEALKRDERIASLVKSWNEEHSEVCTLRADLARHVAALKVAVDVLKMVQAGPYYVSVARNTLQRIEELQKP